MSGWRAALVAAVVGGLILGAGWFLSGDDEQPDDPGESTTTRAVDGDLAALACPTALEAACADLAAFLGTRSQRLTGADPGDDVVVIAPVADLPDGRIAGPVVARSPVAIAVWLARAPVLQAHCAVDAVDLGCLARGYGREWGELGGAAAWGAFKLGLADPERSAAGLAAWRAVASGGVPASLGDSLRLRARDDGALMVEVAQFGDSRADAVVTTEVAIASQLTNVQGRGGRLEVSYPDPAPWVDYVASGEGSRAERLIEALLGEEVQARLGALGLRPASGEPTGLMAGLGDPGQPLGPADDALRGTLIDAWNEL